MTKNNKQIDIIDSIQKRFQTAMIGSLARIEDYLGFVWGHNQDMISIEQADNRQLWQDLRDDILDHNNYQMRAALNDVKKFIEQIIDEPNKFTTTFSATLSKIEE